MQNQYRLGIDAGGTFTDFILADRKGGVRIFKALSTPNDPTAAIRNDPSSRRAIVARTAAIATPPP